MDHCFFIKIVQNSYLATISTLLYSSAYLLPLCYFGAEKAWRICWLLKNTIAVVFLHSQWHAAKRRLSLSDSK